MMKANDKTLKKSKLNEKSATKSTTKSVEKAAELPERKKEGISKSQSKPPKRKQKEYLKTKRIQVVDYFPRGGSNTNEDFTFNTALIDRRGSSKPKPESKFLNKKRKNVESTSSALEKPEISEKTPEETVEANQKVQMMTDESEKSTSRALTPRFKIGDLVLLTISEIRKDYMIASYTRNRKAMIHKNYSGFEDKENFSFENYFKIGQFVCGAVVSAGNDIQLEEGYMNKKILASIDPKIINTGLYANKLVVGMDLYGRLIKTAEGYSVDFKFSDMEEDMERFNNEVNKKRKKQFEIESEEEADASGDDQENDGEEIEIDGEMGAEDEEEINFEKFKKNSKKNKIHKNSGYAVNLIDNEEAVEILKDKITSSYYFFKLISVETDANSAKTILNVSLNYNKYKFPIKSCEFKYLRPGFLFKSNITRELLNGVEVAYGGNIGSIFGDHLKASKKNMLTRIIHVSINTKSTSLSTKTNIVNLHLSDIEEKVSLIGKTFENAKVENVLFGNSYEVQLSETVSAFLHSNQTDNRDEKKLLKNEILPKVIVKEYNFFDDKPILSAKKESIGGDFLTWKSMKVGNFVRGTVKEILADKLIIKLNTFIDATLPREHITDFPLHKIPKKFKIGQAIQARIYSVDYSRKNLTLTTKESLLDKISKLAANLSEIKEGDELHVVYVANNLFQHSGNVLGKMMNFNKIQAKENFRIGQIYKYKVYKVNRQTNRLYFTNEAEVWQPGLGDYENIVRRNPILSTIAAIFNDEKNEMEIDDNLAVIKSGDLINFQVVTPKKLVKLLVKKGADVTVLQENIETMIKKYLVVKIKDSNFSNKNLYGFVPVELLSDFYQEKIFSILSKTNTENVLKLMALYYNPESKIIFLTGKQSLISKRSNLIPSNEMPLIKDQIYYGFVNKTSKIGLIAQFLENHKQFIRFKDDAQKESHSFSLGHTLALRYKQDLIKKKKFDLNVYSMYNAAQIKEEGSDYLTNYRKDFSLLFSSSDFHTKKGLVNLINSEIEGKVGIIKDYGVLVSMNVSAANTSITGFLKNEHMSGENYQVGDVKAFRIIDIDIVNSIAYLTDDVTTQAKTRLNTTCKEYFLKEKNNSADFVVELFHDTYISAYLNEDSSIKAIIPCNLYNFDFESSKISDTLKIGDLINSKVVDYEENLNKIITEFPTKIVTKIIASSRQFLGERTKREIAPGSMIKGRINGIKGAYIYVYIDKKTLGRINFTNFKGDVEAVKKHLKQMESSAKTTLSTESQGSTYPEELKINCKILHIESKEGKEGLKICDLTNQIEDNEENTTNDKTRVAKELTLELDISGEKENVGIISKIDLLNKFPIKIDHLSKNYRNTKVQIHFSFIPAENIQDIKSIYRVGDKVIFYTKSKNIEDKEDLVHSLTPFSKIPQEINFENDKLYPVRILKPITGRGLVTDISFYNTHTEGFVDICEISDDLHPNPLNFYKPGTITLGRIVNYDEKAKKYFLSLRHSITSIESFEILKNGSTLKYNKNFENFEKIGDYRNKIYKFGVNQVIESNTVAVGYLTSSSEKGVFIKLATNVVVRAALRELTDEKTTKPFLLFKPDSLVLCRVVSIYRPNKDKDSKDTNNTADPNSKMNVNVSLRESVVKYNLTVRQKDLIGNNFYECVIMNVNEAESKIEVCIAGSTFTGLIKKKMLKDRTINSLKSALENKALVVLQLVKLDKNIHPPKLRFSNLNLDSETFDKNLVINSLSKETEEKNRIHCELYDNVKAINEKLKDDEIAHELRQIEKNVDKIDYENLIHKNFNAEDESDDEVMPNDSDDEIDQEADEENENIEEAEDSEMLIDHEAKLQFLKGLGIEVNDMDVDEEPANDEDSSSEEIKESSSNKRSSKKREKVHIKEELKIRKTEEEITANKLDKPESVEFHEKKILSDPNNSINWIQYASYILDKLNLSSARKIFERAIKTINISLSKEKLNVWIAYMNLENTYGSGETFKDLVERAIEVNDKKVVYKHLISIYKLSNKQELAHEVYKILLKNYFSDISIWKNYLEFLFELENLVEGEIEEKTRDKIKKTFVEPKEGLKKALQTLNKAKNLEMLLAYGQLQYKFDHIEEARNTFESILKNYQKRSDIWMVYVDKEIKVTKNLEKIRNIFERMLHVDLKLKALKSVIKKYMEFEKDFGTAKTLENVKSLTQKIIVEKMRAYNAEEDAEMDVEEEGEM